MTKSEKYDLTQGSIFQKLVRLAMPIMAGQFVQTAYNIVDMFWLGRLGSEAVAASGTAGFYMWLSMALFNYGSRGAEIGVSQSLGGRDRPAAHSYVRVSLSIAGVLGLAFGAFLLVFSSPLIGFFGIREQAVVQDSRTYLMIVSLGVPFTYLTGAIAGVFTGSGNGMTPFYVNAAALVLNMVLDPVLIFGVGLGVSGAAIATVAAQVLACVIMFIALRRYRHPELSGIKLHFSLARTQLRRIFRWATPVAIESLLFTLLSMLISRFVAFYGAGAIAAQRLGSQVESLSYLIAGGFSSAFVAFVGQNYGAGKPQRIRRGYGLSTLIMTLWGLVVTAFLFFGSNAIFTLFLPGETDVIAIGTQYLRILSICQLVGCYEGIASGTFRGLGNTVPASVISIVVNALRVLAAWLLSQNGMGLNGIWWAIAAGAALRSLTMFIASLWMVHKLPKGEASA